MKLTCLRVSEVLMRGTCLYCNVYGLLWAIKEHAFRFTTNRTQDLYQYGIGEAISTLPVHSGTEPCISNCGAGVSIITRWIRRKWAMQGNYSS